MKRLLLPVILCLLWGDAARAVDVIVNKAAPAIARKTFDPDKLPDPKPPLKHDEVAACEYVFRIEMDLQPIPGTPQPAPGGGVKASVRLNQVRVRLSMPTTIWLPKGATEHVKEHEEGHLRIAQTFYKDADKKARELATAMIGKAYEGEGANANAAYGAALQKAAQELNDKYIEAIKTPCDEVEAIYDQITDKARNLDLKSDKAVTQALETWNQAKKKDKK